MGRKLARWVRLNTPLIGFVVAGWVAFAILWATGR
jgi:hypothetical protein